MKILHMKVRCQDSLMSKEPVTEDSIDDFLVRVLPLYPSLDPQTEAAVDRMTKIVKHLDRFLRAHRVGLRAQRGRVRNSYSSCIRASRRPCPPANDRHARPVDRGDDEPARRARGGGIRHPQARHRGSAERPRGDHDAGREILGKAVAAQGEEERSLLEALKPAERETLNALLRRVSSRSRTAPGPSTPFARESSTSSPAATANNGRRAR